MSLLRSLLFSALNISCAVSAAEWTPGVPLPEFKAIVRTIAQLEKGDPKGEKTGSVAKLPVSSQASSMDSAQTKGSLDFTVATYEDSGVVPPDAMGVVGPSQFIVAANGRIRSFNKETGQADHVLDLSSTQFFSPIAEGFTSDSRIRYDRFSDRWFVVITAASMTPIRLLIAMSDRGIIDSNTLWSFFYFEPRPSDWSDYPTLGIDKNALYIGMNFLKERKYVTSDAFVINKESLISGTLKGFAFLNIVDPNPAKLEGPISPQGVDNFDFDAAEGYFIGIDGLPGRLMLRRIKDPAGNPSISGNIPIPVSHSHFPLEVPQRDSFATGHFFLQGFDKRLGNTHVRDKLLYTAHNVAVDNKGNPETANPTRDGCLWYEISLKDQERPVITQSGILSQRSPENDTEEEYFWMPGIMTNGLHTLAVACCCSGDKAYADAAYAMRYSDDSLGSIHLPKIYTKSHVVYKLGFPPFKNLRWGEYTTASVDPTDNMTLWCISEFAVNEISWGLQAIRIPAQPPAHILEVIPRKIESGQKEVALEIVGERVEGSAFYDPGPHFPKHLRVEIADLKVTGVKWISPTEVHIVVNTEGASPGMKEIKMINPDGQMIKSEGLLEVL